MSIIRPLELNLCERRMLDVLKATQRYPVTMEKKSAKHADDITFFCRTREENVDLSRGDMTCEVPSSGQLFCYSRGPSMA